jgi:nucleotide-binding universal stress UspA family protein
MDLSSKTKRQPEDAMYKKILLPLDGSPLSESALPYARFLATALHVPVELLHAIDPDIIALCGSPRYVSSEQSLAESLTDRNLRYLAKVESLFPEPARVSCSVAVSRAEELILAKARTEPSTLIVMATHGYSGIRRWLLGSIAEKVLHGATNPLLLIRATEEDRKREVVSLKTIIVPLDGSPLAEMAIPYAVELASTLDLDITLVRALALPAPISMAEDQAENGQEVGDLMGKEAQDYLNEKAERLRAQGVKKISTAAVAGPAAETIITLTEEKPQSLVVMCTHGKSGVRGWILGSVTERVTRHANEPVLVIRASSEQGAP